MASYLDQFTTELKQWTQDGVPLVEMVKLLKEKGLNTTESSIRRALTRNNIERPESVPKAADYDFLDQAERALKGEKTEEDRLRENFEHEKERRRQAERLLKAYQERSVVEERIEQAIVYALENSDYDVPLGTPKPRDEARQSSDHEFVLLMSDAHYGEQVNPLQAFGLNYDTDVSRRRIQHIRDVTFRYADLRQAAYNVPKITVAVLGDMLSGVIHEELEVNNEKVMSDQVVDMAYIVFNFITDMAKQFDEVDVVIIPGNHPRMEKKPRAKGKFNNFEFIMGKMVEGMINAGGHDDRISVMVPKDLIYVHQVFDYRIGMVHGDGVKSASFAGIPFYGLRNQREAVQALMSTVGQDRIDMFMMGHWHQHLYWQGECDILINGSIKGGDEYGIASRLSAPEPVQVLTEWHPEHGLVGQSHITLSSIR